MAVIGAAAGQTARPALLPLKSFASSTEVESLIAKAKAEHRDSATLTIEPMASIPPYQVQLEYRNGTTRAALHKREVELTCVIGGSATMLQGGTLIDRKLGAGNNIFGTRVEGGIPCKVGKGDFILMPPDTPHQYIGIDHELITVTVHMPMPTGVMK